MTQAAEAAIKLGRDEANLLSARLVSLARTARIFGSALAGVDVQVDWSLDRGSDDVRWLVDDAGNRAVHIRLDLTRMIALLREDADRGERAYVDAFKAGFLHELGHILYSRVPAPAWEAAPAAEDEAPAAPSDPSLRRVLKAVRHTLEDARIERELNRSFRGARRYLEGHADQARRLAAGQERPAVGDQLRGVSPISAELLGRLIALLFLQIWEEDHSIDYAALPVRVREAAIRLKPSLTAAAEDTTGEALTAWVTRVFSAELQRLLAAAPAGEDILSCSPLLDDEESAMGDAAGNDPAAGEASPDAESGAAGAEDAEGPDGGEPVAGEPEETEDQCAGELAGANYSEEAAALSQGDLDCLAESLEEQMTAPDLFAQGQIEHVPTLGGHFQAPGHSRIIVYPHVDGSMVLDEVQVVRARNMRQTDRTRAVMEDVTRIYGPRALEAFAAEADALRRAFQVNFERRFEGRYRSGRHVGVRNLRRFMIADDLRIFQRIQVPDRLSYYFHLLLDVSPSMMTNKNLQKALAIGYAFAATLDRLRVPVDVTLYSSAVTQLYDHRRDTLDRYFGANFGYLSSGTHEIEAIAYAKQIADRVPEERKILVVTTDGQPNDVALKRAGASDLRSYYRETLGPWLHAAGIDLIAIGIGANPSYHPNAVSIYSGWDAIAVFMRLLDEMISRGRSSHAVLWR